MGPTGLLQAGLVLVLALAGIKVQADIVGGVVRVQTQPAVTGPNTILTVTAELAIERACADDYKITYELAREDNKMVIETTGEFDAICQTSIGNVNMFMVAAQTLNVDNTNGFVRITVREPSFTGLDPASIIGFHTYIVVDTTSTNTPPSVSAEPVKMLPGAGYYELDISDSNAIRCRQANSDEAEALYGQGPSLPGSITDDCKVESNPADRFPQGGLYLLNLVVEDYGVTGPTGPILSTTYTPIVLDVGTDYGESVSGTELTHNDEMVRPSPDVEFSITFETFPPLEFRLSQVGAMVRFWDVSDGHNPASPMEIYSIEAGTPEGNGQLEFDDTVLKITPDIPWHEFADMRISITMDEAVGISENLRYKTAEITSYTFWVFEVPAYCGEPMPKQFAEMDGEDFWAGDTVEYECEDGFAGPDGPIITIECTEDGKWDGIYDLCQDVDECDGLPPITASLDSGPDLPEPACNMGECVNLIGTYVCDCPKGFWFSFDESECIKRECERPDPIENADPEDDDDDEFEYGDEMEYRCREGFVREDGKREPIMTKCNMLGEWEGRMECIPITCPRPLPIPLTTQYWTDGPDEFAYGAKLNFRCQPGFTSALTDGDIELECEEDGKWSGVMDFCTDVNECEDPALRCPAVAIMGENGMQLENRCVNVVGSYFCQLQTGNVQTCESYQCANGGQCRMEISGPKCECPPMYSGPQCEIYAYSPAMILATISVGVCVLVVFVMIVIVCMCLYPYRHRMTSQQVKCKTVPVPVNNCAVRMTPTYQVYRTSYDCT